MKRNRNRPPVAGRAKKSKTSIVDSESTVVYGVMPVLEALRASAGRIRKILIFDGRTGTRTQEISDLARSQGVPVSRVTRDEVSEFVPADATHQGVAALVRNIEFVDSEALIRKACETQDSTLLVIDGVEDPRNLGAIIRTAECSGVTGIFIPQRRAAGITDTAVKSSSGAVNHVDIAKVTNINRLLEELKSVGIWTVGTAGDAEMIYSEWDFTQPTAIVLGGEGKGIRRLTAESCDTLVRIPMCGTIDSLNVSVAAGVLLFESVRQKTSIRS